jgi:small subunit ribosomal protein S2
VFFPTPLIFCYHLPLKDSATRSDLNPLAVHDYFGVHKLFTVKDLFDARVHLGHKASALDSRMGQFMFGTRFGTSIIDLDQTTLLLRQALNFTAHIAYRNAWLFH